MRPFSLVLLLAFSHSAEAAVPLNSATAAELDTVEGVDDALAMRIVDLREQRGGRFGSVEALRILDLPAATLDALREGTVVDTHLQVATVGGGRSYSSVEDVLSQFDGEPDIRTVQDMVLRYSNAHPDMVEGWLRASTNAYFLPRMRLTYRKDLDLSEGFIYITQGDDDVAELVDATAGNDDYYEAQFEWRLDKLVMSSERIRVISEAQDIVKLRDKVLDEVTRLYFDRRRLQVEMLMSPPASLEARLRNELRLQELTANLDAYTGGQFSASTARPE